MANKIQSQWLLVHKQNTVDEYNKAADKLHKGSGSTVPEILVESFDKLRYDIIDACIMHIYTGGELKDHCDGLLASALAGANAAHVITKTLFALRMNLANNAYEDFVDLFLTLMQALHRVTGYKKWNKSNAIQFGDYVILNVPDRVFRGY